MRPDGAGHQVIAEIATKADALNPALAARLLTSFEQWKKLEPKARASAEAVLKELSEGKLSKNARDIVGRALD